MKSVALIVLNNFQNDSRVLKEAISLKDNGFKVIVVALHEAGCLEKEYVEGIEVRRIKLKSRSWSKNRLIQFLKYFEFLIKSSLLSSKYDIIHCNDIKALPVGFFIKKFLNKKVKIVYDAHEYESQMYGLLKIESYFIYLVERKLIKYASVVFTVSNSIANEYKKLYSIQKPTLIFNTPIFKKVLRISKEENIFRQKFNIHQNQKIFIYQGGFSKSRGIESILVTFDHINTHHSGDENSKPVIIFMGYGFLLPLINQFAKRCSNIFYHPAVKINMVFNYTQCADFGILNTENTCLNNYYCMPNKIFEYLMAEVPVIASNTKDVKEFVFKHKIGVVSKTNDVYGLQQAIYEILEMESDKFQQNILSVKKEYNWEAQETKMIEAYQKL
jgi:glycosyltransferase involved in cell wall biosynthesis